MNKIRVLMVDDNVSLIEMIKEYSSNHQKIEIVLSANNGEDGIKLIESKRNEYDVIVLDLLMPKKDGVYVLEQMKERNITKQVIVLTRFDAADMIRRVSSY